MAASSRVIRVIEITNNLPVYKNYDSKTLELMLKTLSVTSDNGTTILTISESSGAFAFGNKVLGGVAQPVAAGDVVATSTGNKIAPGLLPDLSSTYIATSLKGANNGVAELDGTGKVPSTQLPSYVDDVLEFANLAAFPGTGETSKIYVALDTNLCYRWTGTVYTEISPSLALGETSGTAYRGDRGKTAYDHSQLTSSNPHGTTAAQVGADPAGSASTVQGNLTTHINNTSNPHSVTKAQVGLTNVGDVQQLPMSYLDTDGTLAANSDTKVPSQAAVKTYVSAQLGSAISAAFANKEGGSVAHTIRQLTFLDTAAGGMKKALATNAALSPSVLLGMVRDASIADQASGQYYLPRKGTVVGGFTGLTVGPVYLSRTTAGATAYDLTGFITGDSAILVGWAISATEVLWVGEYQYQIG